MRASTLPVVLLGMLSWSTVGAATLDSGLLAAARQGGPQPVLIVGHDQSTPLLAPLSPDADVRVRRRALVAALQARAEADQALVRDWLDRHGVVHRDYWIANVIAAELSADQMEQLAVRMDVARVAANWPVHQPLPPPPELLISNDTRAAVRQTALPWGLEKINAPEVWAHGVLGQGVVVAGQDTGIEWDHPAIKAQYLGWDGIDVDHNYHWHDAIHVDGSRCGADARAPCDDDGHGTHTVGTMVGDDSMGERIGVAPQARWIGCRNMNDGWGSPARYIECMQWLLAPTDLDDNSPDPDRAPDVVNNSWACVAEEGCTTGQEIRAAVDNLIAGGIFFAASAGNWGPSCGTVLDAPATYPGVFTIAASDEDDALAGFSSRGPIPGVSTPAVDLTAPGVRVYSSWPPHNYAYASGTSMASPHVAGTAALMISANPALRGQPGLIARILRATAVQGVSDPYNTSCGGMSVTQWPNQQAGHGRLDAWAAVRMAQALLDDGSTEPARTVSRDSSRRDICHGSIRRVGVAAAEVMDCDRHAN